MKEHIDCVKDGAIVMFEQSPCYFMKVCDRYGQGGVVRLFGGQYMPQKI